MLSANLEMSLSPHGVDYAIVDYGTPRLAAACRRSIERCYERSRDPYSVAVRDARARGETYAQAVNRALADGCAPIVCALNADTEMLEHPRAVFDVFDSDPDIAVVGPRQVDDHGLIRHAGIFGTNQRPGHRLWSAPLTDHLHETAEFARDAIMVSGSVMFARRSAWEEVGGFELETRHYFEDTAFCYVVRHHGWRVVYTGATTWLHLWDRSLPSGGRHQGLDNDDLKRRWFTESRRTCRDFLAERDIACWGYTPKRERQASAA